MRLPLLDGMMITVEKILVKINLKVMEHGFVKTAGVLTGQRMDIFGFPMKMQI